MTEGDQEQWQTSLGPSLVKVDETWRLDVSDLQIVHGLSVLSRALTEMLIAKVRAGHRHVAVRRSLRPREHPELIEDFGVDGVELIADDQFIERFQEHPDVVEQQLRRLLGSLQRKRYRDALLPVDGRPSRTLLADFEDGPTSATRCEVSYAIQNLADCTARARGDLRVVVHAAAPGRASLHAKPHLRIEDIADRQFIAGSTRIAQTWTEALRREAVRSRRSFVEQRAPHSHLFHQLDQAGLGSIQQVSVHWAEAVLPLIIENEPAVCETILKRVLLALEDGVIRRLLADREVVCVIAGAVPVFVDISQLGRVLTFSVGQTRGRDDADAFLRRMPAVSDVVARHREAAPLDDVPVFLIHHMTAEIVGLIAAIRALGCRDLTCLFVSYAGQPPSSYLDAVLDLPSDEFCALSLVNLPQPGAVEGKYCFSQQYSQLDPDEERDISRALEGRTTYLDAMRAAAVVPFLRQLARAEQRNQRCLIVEDGGYLAPALMDAMARGLTVGQFARELGHDVADERPVAAVAKQRTIATVEHTRNGFDRLEQVRIEHGHLPLPTYSIAISRLKRSVESCEVAASVLSAIESVLNAAGRVLSRRRCLVLGSRGAIGGELCRHLRTRLDRPAQTLTGVDLKVDRTTDALGITEAHRLEDLSEARWLDTDLVIGVTGESVLRGGDIETWLRESDHDTLTLVSGSTKKVEFAAIMRWFDDLVHQDAPRIDGARVSPHVHEMLDPRTARAYGHRWVFDFDGARPTKTIMTLANLTPVNFLFYGVATEIIDEVLAQLLSVSLSAAGDRLDPAMFGRLLAVDRDVDADGEPLVSSDRRSTTP